jgi:hypothetical protein
MHGVAKLRMEDLQLEDLRPATSRALSRALHEMKAHVERWPTYILIRDTQQSFHRRCYADIGLVSAISLGISASPFTPISTERIFKRTPESASRNGQSEIRTLHQLQLPLRKLSIE